MKINLQNLSASDYAAWWGAIIASLALIWNIVTSIRSGARIKIRAIPNMLIVPAQHDTEGKKFILITAINRGTSSTTITNYCGYSASSFFDLLRGIKQHFVVLPYRNFGDPIPHVISPGEEWKNYADQQNIKDNNPDKYLYIGVMHNQKKEPIYKRIRI